MLVNVVAVLVVPVPVVNVVHVVTMLHCFVTVPFVVLTVMVCMHLFLGVPFTVVQVVDVVLVLPGGVAVAGQVFVIGWRMRI